MRSWPRCESGRIEARKRKENGRKEYEESMAAERERVDSIHAHAAGTRDKHRRINYARCVGRAARRTARSIQLSLFLPEFTDVSAIIEDRRAY